jgi:hypothetical protein
MRNIPLSVLQSWPRPNYIDPPTRGSWAVAFFGVLSGIVVVIVLLRCYTRAFIQRWFGWDDILIIFALVSFELPLGSIVEANQFIAECNCT